MIEQFDAFGIVWKDKTTNKMADLLENIAIKPDDITFSGISKVEVQTRPSVANNVQNWQVFEDDRDFLQLLTCEEDYQDIGLDWSGLDNNRYSKEKKIGEEIVQLKLNKKPKGLVALECIFDDHEIFKNYTHVSRQEQIEKVNLGNTHSTRDLFIGKNLSDKIIS